eukprot:ANDGO_00432.mRNA.1 Proteasome activator subunit 4
MSSVLSLLPADQQDAIREESAVWKEKILQGLETAYDTKYVSVFAFWVRQADAYLDMKRAFTVAEKSVIVNMLIKMAFTFPSHTTRVRRWFKTVARLCKPYEELPNLHVDWKPFYVLIETSGFGRMRGGLSVKPAGFLQACASVVECLRDYFSPDAAAEILEYSFSKLCPQDEVVYRSLCLLSLFLPSCGPAAAKDVKNGFPWVSELIRILSWMDNSPAWDLCIFSVLSRLAEQQPGVVDWKPHMEYLMTRILRIIDVPIGSSPVSARRNMQFPNSTQFFFSEGKPDELVVDEVAVFLIYLIRPKDSPCGYNGLSILQKVFSSIESYYHPSNGGGWTGRLAILLESVASGYCERARRERFECRVKYPVSQEWLLSEQDDADFTEMLYPICKMALLSKHSQMVWTAIVTTKHLVSLSPLSVLPRVIEMASHALQTLTETHQTTALLRALAVSTRMLIQQSTGLPNGLLLLGELFNLALPGIDPNDSGKTRSTLSFFSVVFSSIPVAPSGAVRLSGDNPDVQPFLDMLHSWPLQFVRRLVVALGSFREENKRALWMAVKPIERSILKVFQNLHPSFVPSIVSHLVTSMFSEINVDAVKPISTLFGQICRAHPADALPAFLPPLFNRLLSDHAFTEVECNWFVTILRYSIRRCGRHLLKFRLQIERVLETLMNRKHSESKNVFFKQGCKLLRCILEALTMYYVDDFRSLNPDEYDELLRRYDPSEFWGRTYKPEEVQVVWHVPSREELDWALEIIEKYGSATLQFCQQFLTSSFDDKVALEKFQILRAVFRGASTLLPKDFCLVSVDRAEADRIEQECSTECCSQVDDSNPQDDDRRITFRPSIAFFGKLYGEYRNRVAGFSNDSLAFVRSFNKVMSASHEDKVPVLSLLCKLYMSLVCFHGISREKVRMMERIHTDVKNYQYNTLLPREKSYIRSIWLDRAELLYAERLSQVVDQRCPSVIFRAVMHDLINLSMHQFSKVRKIAQTALTSVVYMFPVYTVQSLLQIPIRKLQDRSSSEWVITGSCYVLTTFSGDIMCSWDLLLMLAVTLIKVERFDVTASVQGRVNQLFATLNSSFYDLAILSNRTRELINGRIDEILSVLQSSKQSLSWRGHALALAVLSLCTRQDIPPRLQTVQAALDSLVSEIAQVRIVAGKLLSKCLVLLKPMQPKRIVESDGSKLDMTVMDARASPADKSQRAAFVFLDKNYFGYWSQPRKYEVYDYSLPAQPRFPSVAEQVRLELLSRFKSDPWRSQAIRFMSGDIQQHFSQGVADLAKGLFQICGIQLLTDGKVGDEISRLLSMQSKLEEQHRVIQQAMAVAAGHGAHLNGPRAAQIQSMESGTKFPARRSSSSIATNFPQIAESVLKGEKLVEKADVKDAMALATSIAAGLHRGLKHKSAEDVEFATTFVKSKILPMLYTVDPECVAYFISFIRHVSYDTDPIRIRWLLDRLLGELVSPSALDGPPGLQHRRLKYMNPMLGEVGWRSQQMNRTVLHLAIANTSHPYAQVRDTLASFAAICIHNMLARTDNFDEVFAAMKMSANWKETQKKFFLSFLSHLSFLGTPCPQYVAQNVIAAAQLHSERDEDILKLAKTSLTGISVSLVSDAAHVLDDLRAFLLSSSTDSSAVSWKARSALLGFLQRFAFNHAFIIFKNPAAVTELVDMLSALLMDPHVEVREMATTTLSGLFRVSDPSLPMRLVDKFKQWSNVRVQRDLLRHRRPSALASSSDSPVFSPVSPFPSSSPSASTFVADLSLLTMSPTVSMPTNAFRVDDEARIKERNRLVKRHAGVLGLCAIVLSHPYGVPEWLVPVIVALSRHVDDPEPVNTSVKRCFRDFWRTQKDTWHLFKTMFEPDDLSSLTELVISPNYYA